MAPPPVVTGISPKEGPPGTRVTIRGEFLGNKPTDVVGLTICGCDCLLSAEWKSPNKIVARSGPGKGRGDIVVTTVSGGRGTCTVEFRGYHETVGPLKESAVWVDEAPVQSLGWRSRALSSSSFQIEDPLGLSVEGNEKKFPEDDLLELFPGGNGDLGSEQFCPGWFLLEHHHATSFDDLRVGLSYLRRKVDSQKEGQLSFLKGNVGSVMEQLETLENLKNSFEKDMATFGLDRTEKIEKAIQECMEEGNMLFEGVLVGREKAERTRSALGVFTRFKFLFTLPASIERNMAAGEYDPIISDYARANNLFGKTDVQLFKKVLTEVKLKIAALMEVLKEKLQSMPNSLENQKKIIRSLVQLECEGDPGWEALNVHSKYLVSQLNECHSYHVMAEANQENTKSAGSKSATKHKRTPSGANDLQGGLNHRVECVEDLTQIVIQRMPDMWTLGQLYFNGELHIKPDASKQAQFKRLVVGSVAEMCRLVRACLGAGSPSSQARLGPWLPHCLRHVRYVHSTASSLDLPQQALETLASLILDLRLQCVKTALKNVGEQVKTLNSREDWVLLHDPKYGAITQLPKMFENLLMECANGLKESVLQKGPRESDLFASDQVQKEVSSLIVATFLVYTQVVEGLGASSDDGDHSLAASQISTPTYRQGHHSLTLGWEERVLACASNTRYTASVTVVSVGEAWGAHGLTSGAVALRNSALPALAELSDRLVFAYTEAKSDPLVGTVEPSMYMGHFDWDTDLPPTDLRPYAKEIIANLIAVHAQLEQCASWLKERVLRQIVETVAEEISRLMVCCARVSRCGAAQAHLDITAVSFALKPYTTSHANGFFSEALEAIPALTPLDKKLVADLLAKFKNRMHMQLSCFHSSQKTE